MNFNSLVWYSSLAIGEEKNNYVADFLKRSSQILNHEINDEIKEKNLPFSFNIDFLHVYRGDEGVEKLNHKILSMNDIIFTNGHSINKYNTRIIEALKNKKFFYFPQNLTIGSIQELDETLKKRIFILSRAFIEQGVHHYKPFDFYSHEIFDRLMHKLWKLKMIPKIESGIFAFETQSHEADENKTKLVSEIRHPDFKEQDQKKTSHQNLLFGITFIRDSNSGNALIKLSSYETKLFNKFFQLEKIYYDYRDKVRGKRN